MRIAVVAPSSRFEDADQVDEVEAGVRRVAQAFPGLEIVFHPQCRLPPPRRPRIHFAGTDAERLEALVAVANDPAYDAVWFARGGYGSNRIAEAALARFLPPARDKAWLGYSDAGFLLAGLYRAGYPDVAHGPMPKDVLGGDAPISRALAWLARREATSLEPRLRPGGRYLAFNITVLGMLLGTPLEPDFAAHELLLEDLSEYLYATDRALFHITSSPAVRRCAGIRMGRIAVKDNPGQPFGGTAEQVVRDWCGRAGIEYRGEADIGHDSANKVVPFGLL